MTIVSTVAHYDALLAPVYEWMCGGIAQALQDGRADVAPFCPGRGLAVDLGAGFGRHAIPLAEAGYDVVAVDQSRALLQALAHNAGDLAIRTVEAALLDFRSHVDRPAALILCMGDTLCHLASREEVRRLVRHAAAALDPGGAFIATFRSYGDLPRGSRRIVLVRGDATRILTCMLEGEAEHVAVHDLLHERAPEGWGLRVSAYRKARIDPVELLQAATEAGLDARLGDGPKGFTTFVARKEGSLRS
ncbi:MAG: class I SAM-dependent methyltransferase [Alphaproteobacteria bacterium]|nr:class I SAM-dependent methyltransferase [Alphaproteobacteria bacterium]